MAIGVGSSDYRYRNTNYTFLETTNVSFVGVPTEKLGSGISLQSYPIIIPIGRRDPEPIPGEMKPRIFRKTWSCHSRRLKSWNPR